MGRCFLFERAGAPGKDRVVLTHAGPEIDGWLVVGSFVCRSFDGHNLAWIGPKKAHQTKQNQALVYGGGRPASKSPPTKASLALALAPSRLLALEPRALAYLLQDTRLMHPTQSDLSTKKKTGERWCPKPVHRQALLLQPPLLQRRRRTNHHHHQQQQQAKPDGSRLWS